MVERVAVIDLGSNSVRLVVMHIYNNGAYNLVYHQKETLRLVKDAEENLLPGKKLTLSSASIERGIETLKMFAHMCKVVNAEKIMAVATAAVRNASNGQEFIAMAKARTGISFRIISGAEEARLGYIGVINTIDVKDALLFDLGGASTEITLIKDRQITKTVSLPFGAVNLTEKFDCYDRLTEFGLAEMQSYIFSHLEKHTWLQNLSLPIVGIGGTIRNIAKMDQRLKEYPFPKIHNYRLSNTALNLIWKNLLKTTLSQRRKISGLGKERADIIVAGVTVVESIAEISAGTNLIVSGCGLREGIFFKHYFKCREQEEVIPNILRHSTENLLLFYKSDYQHHLHVKEMAKTMFEAWQAIHKMNERHKILLQVAAMLHDIGITINYYDHARHSAYLIENARLFGLTHREQMLTAVVALWHSGHSAKYLRYKLYNEFLDQIDWQVVRKLAVLLALAESLETTRMGMEKSIHPTIVADQAILKIDSSHGGQAVLEIQAASEHRKWFKKEMGVELVIK